MGSSFRCAARVAAVALSATVVLVAGQVQWADAAHSSPGRAGGCLRQGSIFDFQCPVMPAPEDTGPVHVKSAPHPAPAAWSRARARHIDHAQRSDAPVHAYGREVHRPVVHHAVNAQHPVEQARTTQARPHTEQAPAHRSRTVAPAQQPAQAPTTDTPAQATNTPAQATNTPAQATNTPARAPAADTPAQQPGKPSVQNVAPAQQPAQAPTTNTPAQRSTQPTTQAAAPAHQPAEEPTVNPPTENPPTERSTQPMARTEAASRARTAPRTHPTAHRLDGARAHVKRHLPHSGY
jgi:hypothetical protein